jgi:hypothetical protein
MQLKLENIGWQPLQQKPAREICEGRILLLYVDRDDPLVLLTIKFYDLDP